MKNTWILTLSALSLSALSSHALIVGPYTVDANTVQLFSLDEAAGTSTVNNDVGSGYTLDAVNGNNTSSTLNTSILGASSFTGFGNAADLSGASNHALMYTSSTVTPGNLGFSTSNGFTMEAMVNINSITDGQQEIISLDSNGTRSFQFVISSTGQLRFQQIWSGTPQFNVDIPTTGPDAFQADTWFHVAVSYNGNQGAADNLQFYWTLMDNSRTEANLIGSATLTSDPTGGGFFTLGNEGRQASNENLKGLLDEVRISNIARAADEMMFAPIPEPSTYAMIMGAGALGLLLFRRRRNK